MIVSELSIYPLKSGRGIKCQQVRVETRGFVGDRDLMLVSGTGKFITQRQFPQLAKVQVEIIGSDFTFKVDDRSIPDLAFTSIATGRRIKVEIWRDRIFAIDQGDRVADWFHQLLNLPSDKVCRLVRQSAESLRFLPKKYSQDGARPLSFADNSPVMLTATASLDELNQRIVEIHQQSSQAISMDRFRPNVVVSTIEPFTEDIWESIQIGEVQFKVAKPCSRCIITTIDQQLGEKTQLKEPLNTLGTFRQFSEQGVMFGVNIIPQNEGTIDRGDRLQVLKTRS